MFIKNRLSLFEKNNIKPNKIRFNLNHNIDRLYQLKSLKISNELNIKIDVDLEVQDRGNQSVIKLRMSKHNEDINYLVYKLSYSSASIENNSHNYSINDHK